MAAQDRIRLIDPLRERPLGALLVHAELPSARSADRVRRSCSVSAACRTSGRDGVDTVLGDDSRPTPMRTCVRHMVVCILLPRFELAVAAGGREALAAGPLALAPEIGREPLIGETSAAAEAYGVRAGLRLGEALARCPTLRLVTPDPGRRGGRLGARRRRPGGHRRRGRIRPPGHRLVRGAGPARPPRRVRRERDHGRPPRPRRRDAWGTHVPHRPVRSPVAARRAARRLRASATRVALARARAPAAVPLRGAPWTSRRRAAVSSARGRLSGRRNGVRVGRIGEPQCGVVRRRADRGRAFAVRGAGRGPSGPGAAAGDRAGVAGAPGRVSRAAARSRC